MYKVYEMLSDFHIGIYEIEYKTSKEIETIPPEVLYINFITDGRNNEEKVAREFDILTGKCINNGKKNILMYEREFRKLLNSFGIHYYRYHKSDSNESRPTLLHVVKNNPIGKYLVKLNELELFGIQDGNIVHLIDSELEDILNMDSKYFLSCCTVEYIFYQKGEGVIV